jgi:flagellar protein FlbD
VIFITRTNGTRIYINPDLIQTVEATPDTVITLVSSKKMIVKDTPQEIAERYIEYRRKVMTPVVTNTAGK